MDFPRDPDKQRELVFKASMQTNELLAELIQLLTPKAIEATIETKKGIKDIYSLMKRPELQKALSKLKNKPPGFQTWKNDKMIEYLKEASHESNTG